MIKLLLWADFGNSYCKTKHNPWFLLWIYLSCVGVDEEEPAVGAGEAVADACAAAAAARRRPVARRQRRHELPRPRPDVHPPVCVRRVQEHQLSCHEGCKTLNILLRV